jgi:ABC-type multidrug transport system fused ATPase/permease subunit
MPAGAEVLPEALPDDALGHVPQDTLRRGFGVLWTAVREQPRIFAVAVAGSGTYGLMTVVSAWVIGWATNQVIMPSFRDGHTTSGALAAAAVAIAGVALVKAVGITFRRLGAGTLQYRLQADYRRRVTRQYLRLPLAWHQRHSTGELLSNANSDVESSWWPISPFPFATGVVLMLVVAAVGMLVTDPVLALVGFCVFPVIGVVNYFYNRAISPLAGRVQQLRADVSEVAHESFDGALVVKTLGREEQETARFRVRAEDLRDATIRLGRVQAVFDPIMEALPQLGTLVVLLIGVQRIRSGAIDTGDLVEIAYLFTLLAFPVRAIGWVLGELPRAVVGFERVRRVLSATGSLPYGREVLPDRSDASRVDVRGVSFRYAGGDQMADVLHRVGFEVRPGRTVAVVGQTGSGKSTLASLLVRLVDPDEGTVALDGIDVRDLAQGGVAQVAALVPQQTFLFDDTVRGNVTLGLEVADERVWDALRLAQADRFVRALPAALDTLVGERGTTLSGGQRQRLALARALLRQPRLLILDDATSSVDPSIEAAILRGLRDAQLPSTVVVIAYRRATIALADEVVFLEHGRVRAQGRHEDLLASVPAYAALVTAYDRDDEGEGAA